MSSTTLVNPSTYLNLLILVQPKPTIYHLVIRFTQTGGNVFSVLYFTTIRIQYGGFITALLPSHHIHTRDMSAQLHLTPATSTLDSYSNDSSTFPLEGRDINLVSHKDHHANRSHTPTKRPARIAATGTHAEEEGAVLFEVVEDVGGEEDLGQDEHGLLLYLQPLRLSYDSAVRWAQLAVPTLRLLSL